MLSHSHMGPRFDFGTGVQLPMSAPPVRTRNMSGGSTSSMPETQFPFHLLSQISGAVDLSNSAAVINPALLAMAQQPPNVPLERSVSLSECSTTAQQAKINAASQQNKNMVNPSRYKTEVCRPYNENGFCKYGEKCQFAHGDHELKTLPRHPKYKTELCRTFHTVGFCPYGPRCHFIHSEDEYKLVEISQMKQQQAAQQAAKEMAHQAAHIQAQQQALQAQLKALVSQFQHQLATQIVTQGLGQPQMPCDSSPNLCHSMNLHALMKATEDANRRREHLGSEGDTPTESMSGSPVHSPVFADDTVSEASLSDGLSAGRGSAYTFVTSPVSSVNSSFNFSSSSSSSTGELSPLQMSPVKPQQYQQQQQQQQFHQQNVQEQMDPACMLRLTANLQRICINKSTAGENVISSSPPPSSPDYHSDNSENHCRLPVFSRLAQQNAEILYNTMHV